MHPWIWVESAGILEPSDSWGENWDRLFRIHLQCSGEPASGRPEFSEA